MKKLNEIIKKVPIKILQYFVGREVAIGFIEGILARAKIYDILYMIENDKYNLFDNNPKVIALIKKSKRIILDNENIIRDAVTPDEVLAVLRESRPDIYSLIINHKKGRKWVENTIKHSLDYLFSIANDAK